MAYNFANANERLVVINSGKLKVVKTKVNKNDPVSEIPL